MGRQQNDQHFTMESLWSVMTTRFQNVCVVIIITIIITSRVDTWHTRWWCVALCHNTTHTCRSQNAKCSTPLDTHRVFERHFTHQHITNTARWFVLVCAYGIGIGRFTSEVTLSQNAGHRHYWKTKHAKTPRLYSLQIFHAPWSEI